MSVESCALVEKRARRTFNFVSVLSSFRGLFVFFSSTSNIFSSASQSHLFSSTSNLFSLVDTYVCIAPDPTFVPFVWAVIYRCKSPSCVCVDRDRSRIRTHSNARQHKKHKKHHVDREGEKERHVSSYSSTSTAYTISHRVVAEEW